MTRDTRWPVKSSLKTRRVISFIRRPHGTNSEWSLIIGQTRPISTITKAVHHLMNMLVTSRQGWKRAPRSKDTPCWPQTFVFHSVVWTAAREATSTASQICHTGCDTPLIFVSSSVNLPSLDIFLFGLHPDPRRPGGYAGHNDRHCII